MKAVDEPRRQMMGDLPGGFVVEIGLTMAQQLSVNSATERRARICPVGL